MDAPKNSLANDSIVSDIINILPDILWIALIFFVVIKFKAPITQLLSRLGSVKIGEMELQFVSHAFESIFKNASTHQRWPAVKVNKENQLLITNRINRLKNRISGRKILWVDDHPEFIEIELSLLKQINVDYVTVTNTADALKKLSKQNFDVVISDIDRDSNSRAGLDMLSEFKKSNITTPVIFYVGNIQKTGTPAGAFGITNEPDKLLHLFIDAIERSL